MACDCAPIGRLKSKSVSPNITISFSLVIIEKENPFAERQMDNLESLLATALSDLIIVVT
jgi:hypothetical protein